MPRKIFHQIEPTAKAGCKRKAETPVRALQWKGLEIKMPFCIPGRESRGLWRCTIVGTYPKLPVNLTFGGACRNVMCRNMLDFGLYTTY